VIIGDISGKIKAYNSNKLLIKTVNAHGGSVFVLYQLPNNLIASGSEDTTIKIWSTQTWSLILTYTGLSGSVKCIEYLGNDTMVSGGYDNLVKIWKLSTGVTVASLDENYYYGYKDIYQALFIKILPNGLLAYGRYGQAGVLLRSVSAWNSAYYGNFYYNINSGMSSYVFDMKIIGNFLVGALGFQNKARIWNLTTGSIMFTLNDHVGPVYKVKQISSTIVASSAGSYISQPDNSIKLWNLTTGDLIKTLTDKFAPDENNCDLFELYTNNQIVTGSKDGILRFVDISNDTIVETVNTGSQIKAILVTV
jgi:WD40 repeat protein